MTDLIERTRDQQDAPPPRGAAAPDDNRRAAAAATGAQPAGRLLRAVIPERTADEVGSAIRAAGDDLSLSARRVTARSAAATPPCVWRSGPGSALRRLFEIVRTWRVRRRERSTLLELDDRLLQDVGITRADVYREASKPFWRA